MSEGLSFAASGTEAKMADGLGSHYTVGNLLIS
jgi:hypothetical protein